MICYKCSKPIGEYVKIKIPCGLCTTDIEVILCTECSKDLVVEILNQLIEILISTESS